MHTPLIKTIIRVILSGLVLVSLSLVTGCSTTKVLHAVTPPSDGVAQVYFIRNSYPPYFREINLFANSIKLATISNNDYVAVNIPVGDNSIFIKANDGKDITFDLPIEKAEKYYVVLTGDVTKTGSDFNSYNGLTVYLQWNLNAYPVSEVEAGKIIQNFGGKLN
ncbi:MAG: hypothetical protein MJK12_11210 [Colwellia sp.]|nr:hypothetical protein [Colwellia sp.]